MSSNICGNCANFKPKPGEKFFNCTKAKQAGVNYGMQVRADTRSCDAFEPLKPAIVPKPTPKPVKAKPQVAKLCPWGRLILVAAIILIILLLAWALYTCAKNVGGGPAPTPTPTPTGPTPTPIPMYLYQDYEIGVWAVGRTQSILPFAPGKSATWTATGGANIAPQGTEFVWFTFTISNIGVKPSLTVNPGSFWLTDSEGRLYFPAGNPVYYPLRYNSITIYPGETGGSILPYIVPTYAKGLQINYIIDYSTVPRTVARWKLPW